MLKYVELQEEIQKQQLNYWQKNYNKLYAAYEQLQKETIERDYEEVCFVCMSEICISMYIITAVIVYTHSVYSIYMFINTSVCMLYYAHYVHSLALLPLYTLTHTYIHIHTYAHV